VILSNHKIYASKKFGSPLLSFDKLINADADAILVEDHRRVLLTQPMPAGVVARSRATF
jgi:hypothetical protein